jgi:hypothetical protein
MQWDSVRDALLRTAPYVVWLMVALATSLLVAIIREPLCRILRDAREQLRTLRTRLLSRSAISLGRRFHRFWLARRYEPARTVAGALDRLADSLPLIGKRSLARVATLESDLRKQLGMLEALGMHPPSPRPGLRDATSSSLIPQGSWWKLLMLTVIAGLTGAANSFLLNEFFQGVITSDSLFPTAFPDLHVSHIFAVLIFTMEVAIGFALHHFAEEHEDGSAARRLLALAPWLVLVGLLWLEGWAYALLSYQIDIPERLSLPATSGLYSFARYFLALFGAGLTLLLASLGYLLGNELEKLQVGREARRQERLVRQGGWALSQREAQIERTARSLERLRAATGSFQLNLVDQFKREVETASGSDNLLAAVRDSIDEILDSARTPDGGSEAWIGRFPGRERRPVRTSTQAVAEMSLYTASLAALVAVSTVSGRYVAAFVRDVQGDRPSADLLALVSGVVLTGFSLSVGYLTGRAWTGTRSASGAYLPASSTGRRTLRLLTLVFLIASSGGHIAVALANRTLGPSIPLNVLFGLLHTGVLVIVGAASAAGLVNGLHALELAGLYLERLVASLSAIGLWVLGAFLAILDWLVWLVSVFGQLVVRPRPPVQVGVAEISRRVGLPRELRSPARRFTDKAHAAPARGESA